MTEYKKIMVCIPCSSFKEQMKAVSDLIDEGYHVETGEGYVIGIKQPKKRRKRNETRKFKRKNNNKF